MYNEGNLQFKQYGNEDYCYDVCDNEDDPFLTATISGLGMEQFEAESLNAKLDALSVGEGSLLISGRREAGGGFSAHTIRLRIFDYKGVGTYPVGEESPSNEGADGLLTIKDNIHYYSQDSPSGHVTITEECETYIKGAFSFPVRRGTRNAEINNGNFEINF